MDIEEYIQYSCNVAYSTIKNNNEKDTQVIEGVAEVNVNGVDYQVQLILEPDSDQWVHEDKPTIRKVVK